MEYGLRLVSSRIRSEKSAIFIQSQVKEHAELHLLFMITPLSWLERVPTYKVKFTSLVYKERTFLPMDFRLSFANVCRYSIISSKRCTGWRRSTAPLGTL